MQLLVQEKASLNGKVEVKDANEKIVFKGKNASRKKTFLYDAEGNKIITIKLGGFFTPVYTIKKGKQKIAKMTQKLSLVSPKFNIKELGWEVKGNMTFTEYHITHNGEKVADINKKSMVALLETYTVDIVNDADAAAVIAVVMVVNRILQQKKGNLVKSLKR